MMRLTSLFCDAWVGSCFDYSMGDGAEVNGTEWNRTEPNRMEPNRTEPNRANRNPVKPTGAE